MSDGELERPEPREAQEGFSAPEKVTSFVRLVMSQRNEPMVRMLNAIYRTGLARPWLSRLPPADDPEAWDHLLQMVAGLSLNLISDDVELDVDRVVRDGALLLASAFERFEAETEAGP